MMDNIQGSTGRISSVAVIGAGMSGVLCAAHLIQHGLDVTVFERASTAGGVWTYENKTSPESVQNYPTEDPEDPNEVDPSEAISPPGPCYAELRCLAPTSVDFSPLLNWPEGTPEYVNHSLVERYIQDIATQQHVHRRTRYHTRVDSVRKAGDAKQWTVSSTTCTAGSHDPQSAQQLFDAVVVAAGHYHRPRIPSIPGLQDVKKASPSRVMHSKGYRTPSGFAGQMVLIVGGGISALDIARELAPHARKTYQSCRGSRFDLAAALLPHNAERIGPVLNFHTGDNGRIVIRCKPSPESDSATERVVAGIDTVILATGYITSWPFLGHPLQMPSGQMGEVDHRMLVTKDGYLAQNLHADLFYIPDPTLVITGTPYRVPSFVLFDMQAEVVARVLGGKARLPGREQMLDEWGKRREADGEMAPMERFHTIVPADKMLAYVDGLRAWMNRDAAELGCAEVPGLEDGWGEKYERFLEMMGREDVLTLPLEERWLK